MTTLKYYMIMMLQGFCAGALLMLAIATLGGLLLALATAGIISLLVGWIYTNELNHRNSKLVLDLPLN